MKKARLFELCISIWSLLKETEKERYYYGEGTIGFVEEVAAMLGFDINELSEEELDVILDKLDN